MARENAPLDTTTEIGDLEEVVRRFPVVLAELQHSYDELRVRASRVEEELCHANAALEGKVAELDALKGHLEAVLDALPCGVVERDAAGAVVRVNGAAARILGRKAGALLRGGPLPELQGDAADGEPRELTRPDGSRLVLSSRYAEVPSSGGSVEILDDRTERTALRERLYAADKMAALGTMAAGIAHEIRNPLNAVKGFAALLARIALPDETHRRWASLIVAGASEADAIIENMLSFGSPERLRLETIDARELVASAVQLALPRRAPTLEVRTLATAPDFAGDRIKLRQALRNLIANAADAQGGEGVIEVLAACTGPSVTFTVSDAGPGIPPEVRHRMLDPFFTTRAEGTGLGLALVATIAHLHGGDVRIGPSPSALGGAEIGFHIPYQPTETPAEPFLNPELV